jgi:hypothetical protein
MLQFLEVLKLWLNIKVVLLNHCFLEMIMLELQHVDVLILKDLLGLLHQRKKMLLLVKKWVLLVKELTVLVREHKFVGILGVHQL